MQWLSRFIPHLATKAYPIQLLKRKSVPFQWAAQHKKAFDEIQLAVRNAQWLQHPDLNRQFTVHTDASEKGIGAVLLQEFDGELKPLNLSQNHSLTLN